MRYHSTCHLCNIFLSNFNLNSPTNDKELLEEIVANDWIVMQVAITCVILGNISIIGGRNIQLINLNIGVQDVLATT